MASYMLLAIFQKVTSDKVIDYLIPCLFVPLGITGAEWGISPTGINTGGWGLFIKTEDMARMSQFIIVLPEKDAVIVATAQVNDLQSELNLIWDYLLPSLK